jgi:hypothetical protein
MTKPGVRDLWRILPCKFFHIRGGIELEFDTRQWDTATHIVEMEGYVKHDDESEWDGIPDE